MLSDDEILERGGTQDDINAYAHDVGGACGLPYDGKCEDCTINFPLTGIMGLLFVAGLLFAGIGILLKPANVNAASVYDDVVHITDELVLKQGDPSEYRNFSMTWASDLIAYHENRCNSGGTSSCSIETTLRDLFNSENGNWIVTILDNNASMELLFSTDPNAKLEFITKSGQSPGLYLNGGTVNRLSNISWNPDSIYATGNELISSSSISSSTEFGVVQEGIPRGIFLSTFDISYPSGYEGEIIPDTYIPPSPPETNFGMGMTPDFRYEVNDYNLTLTDITNSQTIEEFEISLCMFQVPNNTYGDNFTEYAYDCDLKTPVLHTFSEYSSYNVLHRMYSEENDLWYETSQVIKIDGSIYTGTAGLDQAGNSIPDILKRLTVPTFGLQSALVAPIEFVRTIPELAGVCEPISLPLPYIDGDLDLPCMTPIYQNHFNAFLLLWQVSLTALVSYATVNKVFAKLRQTYNPKQDRIEPTNL